ncbi:hypothetical protein ACFTWR_26665 [Streptomyces nigra]|uniref:hypothetical protein n=1 Tax=Streptomyces nigra TaxID=1827580 RepID=UPI00363FE5F2
MPDATDGYADEDGGTAFAVKERGMAGVDLRTDAAGVRTDARGFVEADDRLAATASRAWAVGDAAGRPQFTHVSLDDYRIRSRPFLEPARFGTRAASGRQSWTADAAVHPILRE